MVVNGEIELGKLGDPAMSGGIQLGHGKDVGQRAVVGVHHEGVAIQVLLETFGNSPF